MWLLHNSALRKQKRASIHQGTRQCSFSAFDWKKIATVVLVQFTVHYLSVREQADLQGPTSAGSGSTFCLIDGLLYISGLPEMWASTSVNDCWRLKERALERISLLATKTKLATKPKLQTCTFQFFLGWRKNEWKNSCFPIGLVGKSFFGRSYLAGRFSISKDWQLAWSSVLICLAAKITKSSVHLFAWCIYLCVRAFCLSHRDYSWLLLTTLLRW